MKRKTLLTAGAFGAAVTLAASGLVFAKISDTVESEGNTIETDEVPVAHDLRYKLVSEPSECTADDPESFLDSATAPPLFNEMMELEDPAWETPHRFFCAYNAGSTAARVHYGAARLGRLSVEIGPCTDAELDAGDTSCGDGAQGEAVDTLDFRSYWTEPTSCAWDGAPGAFRSGIDLPPPGRVLEPHEACHLELALGRRADASPSEIALASRDQFGFTVAFRLQDVQPPSDS